MYKKHVICFSFHGGNEFVLECVMILIRYLVCVVIKINSEWYPIVLQ